MSTSHFLCRDNHTCSINTAHFHFGAIIISFANLHIVPLVLFRLISERRSVCCKLWPPPFFSSSRAQLWSTKRDRVLIFFAHGKRVSKGLPRQFTTINRIRDHGCAVLGFGSWPVLSLVPSDTTALGLQHPIWCPARR